MLWTITISLIITKSVEDKNIYAVIVQNVVVERFKNIGSLPNVIVAGF
jgi:hypothetical protein